MNGSPGCLPLRACSRFVDKAEKQKTRQQERLRIAVVTETYPPEINGVAATLGVMVHGMIARGHSVEVIRPSQRSDRSGSTRAPHAEVLVRGVPIPGYGSLRMGLPATRLLKKRWRTLRPDVVQVATEGPLGWSATRAARQVGVPVASEFHTNFHAYSKHYGAGWLHGVIARYLRNLHNAAALTMVPTRELAESLSQRGFERVTVVGRGIDTALFDPRRRSASLREAWGVTDDAPVVLHVGRLAPEKNLDLLFAAFDAMRARCPRARLVVVGDGPERSRLAQRYPGHYFAGMRRGEALATHYASADIFLYPSLTETFGNVTLEAMASGLAVVAFDYAAARQHIVHDVSGLLSPFGDAAAFVRHAATLADSWESISRLRQAARMVAQSADWKRVFDALEDALFAAREYRPEGPAARGLRESGVAT
ncbi:MAG: glycosyltransferase [Betaproteobacteria bacterium]|nr:glycosyltransferase [Betaproteobacteria bacterium]